MFFVYFHLGCPIAIVFRIAIGIRYNACLYQISAEPEYYMWLSSHILSDFGQSIPFRYSVDHIFESMLLPQSIRLSFPVTMISVQENHPHLGCTLLTAHGRISRWVQLVDGRWTCNYVDPIVDCHKKTTHTISFTSFSFLRTIHQLIPIDDQAYEGTLGSSWSLLLRCS